MYTELSIRPPQMYPHVCCLYFFSGIRNNLCLFFFPHVPVTTLRYLFPSFCVHHNITHITANHHTICLFCALLTSTTRFITFLKHCAGKRQDEMQKAPTKCQPMHFPINRLRCILRIAEQTARNSNDDCVIFKYLKISRRKKWALYRRTFVVSLGVFCRHFHYIVCVNMVGNVDINIQGIKLLWCYSCGSVYFKHCLVSHD